MDRINIEYAPNKFISINCKENEDGSFHFGGVDIKPGETYIDAVCRTVPARQRALTGLALKILSLRLTREVDEDADIEEIDNEENKAKNEFTRLENMTDEEYDKLRDNN